MSVEVLNFGCRLNITEGEVIRRETEKAGLDQLDGGAVIINTCAVTAEAVRQAKQSIRRARRQNPDARIIVTGCAAQTETNTFAAMDEIDLIIGNDDKLKAQSYRALPEFGVNQFEKVRVNDIMAVRTNAPHMVETIDGHARAFVQVQNGCDHRCTFCIIPFGRGNARSVPIGGVVEQVKKLVGNGYQEVVLTGVDLTSFGPDLPGRPKLGDLVQQILRHVPDLPRLRLSSVDGVEIDVALFDAMQSDTRLMPYLHLSLQHGDDMILKRMKRRHTRQQSIDICADLRKRRHDIAFGADLIAGFPTETDAHFEQACSLIKACNLSYVHVFPFSPRKGTPAAKMPQLTRALIKDRARHLRGLAGDAYTHHLDRVSRGTKSLLVERGGIARAEDFTPCSLDGFAEPGIIIEARLMGHDGKVCHAHISKSHVQVA